MTDSSHGFRSILSIEVYTCIFFEQCPIQSLNLNNLKCVTNTVSVTRRLYTCYDYTILRAHGIESFNSIIDKKGMGWIIMSAFTEHCSSHSYFTLLEEKKAVNIFVNHRLPR